MRVTGATGNVPTEDMAHILHEKAIDTGTDLPVLIVAAESAEEIIGETLPGQVIKVGSPYELHPLPPEETAGTALPQELVVHDNDLPPGEDDFRVTAHLMCSWGLQSTLMCRFSAMRATFLLGCQTARSASEPTAMVPF